ncbi:MAG: DUF5667 domain-containing protein [Chloroflexota bacterium]
MDEQFSLKTEDKLEDALAMLAAGLPLHEVLAQSGDDAAWLHPLLEIPGQVEELRQAVPIPSPAASLHKMLSHAEKMAGNSRPVTAARPGRTNILTALLRGGFRLATAAVAAFMVVFLVGGMLQAAAQQSLPGQPLYWLKQTHESLLLNLTRNPDRREQLLETFNQHRRLEIEQLLAEGQEAQVTFEGRVQAVTASAIDLEGLTAQITPDTRISGQLAAGARARVQVKTQPAQRLIALSITVIEVSPLPMPTLTPTLRPTPSLPQVQATDTLPAPPPTATPIKTQDADTLPALLPPTAPTSRPSAAATEETNLNDDATVDDNDGADNANTGEDNLNNSDDFGDDNFDDDFDGDDNSGNGGTDNSGDNGNDSSNSDHSGPGGGSGGSDDSGDSDQSDSDSGHDESGDDGGDHDDGDDSSSDDNSN